jgi:hypothetical protein
MNINSVILLKKSIQLLVQAMALLTKIPEEDYRELVIRARKRTHLIDYIRENIARGHLFMVLFYIREILESISNEH